MKPARWMRLRKQATCLDCGNTVPRGALAYVTYGARCERCGRAWNERQIQERVRHDPFRRSGIYQSF